MPRPLFFFTGFLVPTPTPDEIRDAVAVDALAGIEEAEGDQGSVKMMPLKDRLDAAAAVEAAASGLSGWGGVTRARVVPPGAQ